MNLKKIGKLFTSKFVGTAASFYKKKLPVRGLAKVENHCCRVQTEMCDKCIPFVSNVFGDQNCHIMSERLRNKYCAVDNC
jgi:hypothetical protein